MRMLVKMNGNTLLKQMRLDAEVQVICMADI